MENEITNRYIVSLSLEEAASGCQKTINIKTSTKCTECDGSGNTSISSSKPCRKCQGTGKFFKFSPTSLNIPPGANEGYKLHIKTENLVELKELPAKEIIVTISIKAHKLFKRNNDDIIYELPLNFAQCALGTEVIVPTLKGETKLHVPPGTQTDDLFHLKGKGLPHFGKRGRGDQLIKIRVITPTSLNERQRQLMDQLAETLTEVEPSKKRANKKGGYNQDQPATPTTNTG